MTLDELKTEYDNNPGTLTINRRGGELSFVHSGGRVVKVSDEMFDTCIPLIRMMELRPMMILRESIKWTEKGAVVPNEHTTWYVMLEVSGQE